MAETETSSQNLDQDGGPTKRLKEDLRSALTKALTDSSSLSGVDSSVEVDKSGATCSIQVNNEKELQLVQSNLCYVPPQPAPAETGPTLTIQNMVATVNMCCLLDLKKIHFYTRNSEYNPSRFNGLVMRLRDPRATALIFTSGKLVTTGTKHEAQALLATRKFVRIIQKLGYNAKFKNFGIHNMVSTCDLRFPIRLESLHQAHGQFTSYEPEIFPALIYRLVKPRVVLLIFVNGKLVITGAKTKEDTQEALDTMHRVLKMFKKQ